MKQHHRTRHLIAWAAAAGLLGQFPAMAATVGLYRFDTIGDSVDGGGGEYFFDSSGNNLSLVNQWQSWAPYISNDVPAVAPTGSFSLLDPFVPFLETPSTNLYSLGNTGQLTVEFWYKPKALDSIHYIAGQSSSNNAWVMYQKSPVAGKSAIEFYATRSNGTAVTVSTPAIFDLNSGWNHVAMTVDGTGTGRFYINGGQVGSNTGFTGFSSHNSTLKLGSQPGTGSYSNHFLMDDLRISNVALPSGTGNGNNQLSWNASLSQGLPSNVARPADFGSQWIRQHPFMINSWLSSADVDDLPLFDDANFTASLGGWYQSQDDYGIEQHYLGGYISLDDNARRQMHIANNLPNLTGWLLADEILPEQIPGLVEVANHIRAIDPDGILYAGMGSSNPTYITQVVQATKPDALIHGYYPFFGTSGTDVNGHFADFVFFRRGALENNLPFFTFIQSFDDSGTVENRRLPSESELRFEVFTKLAGGAQGIAYFVFDANNAGPAVGNALLNRQGIPSSLYAPAKQMNAEVQNLGRSLRFLQTTEWRYVRGMTGAASNPVPTHMVAFSANPSLDPHILAVNVDTANAANKGALKDGVIGFFEDDDGKNYFMLTNVFHGTGVSAAASSLGFIVQFDASINSLLRLNRLTGEPERVRFTNNRLSLTLPGGTGDLFKYDDGMFPGIVLGDTDLDNDVDLADLSNLASKYGTPSGSRWSWGDFDLDGDTDLSDLSTLAAFYGAGEAQAFADFQALNVPEAGMTGGLLVPLLLLRRGRQSRSGTVL